MNKASCITMSNNKVLCVHKIFYTKPWNLQNQSFKRNLEFENKIHGEYELLILLQLVLLIITMQKMVNW
jgi:ABC-type lipoprotein release transport system permease subunit